MLAYLCFVYEIIDPDNHEGAGIGGHVDVAAT